MKEAVAEAGATAEVEHVSDLAENARHGIFSTPAVVVDGDVEPSNTIHFSENILDAPLEEMVCYCSGVTKAQILDAIQAGVWSLEQLKAATGACTVGKCAELSPRKR